MMRYGMDGIVIMLSDQSIIIISIIISTVLTCVKPRTIHKAAQLLCILNKGFQLNVITDSRKNPYPICNGPFLHGKVTHDIYNEIRSIHPLLLNHWIFCSWQFMGHALSICGA